MSWRPWVPGEGMPCMNNRLVCLWACVIARLRLARERQVHAWHSTLPGALLRKPEDTLD